MSKNWPMLIETAEHIIDHPEYWDQAWYFQDCGTQACFAGSNDLIDILVKLDEWAFADGQELSRKLYEKLEELLDAAAAIDGF